METGMTEQNAAGWGADEWNKVRQTVHDEALRARVAASFLPLYGPLADDVQTVPANRLDVVANDGLGGPAPERMAVDDLDVLRLCTLSVNVVLNSQQAADPELSSALIMFRRAADMIARVEDALIFNGQPGPGAGPLAGVAGVPPVLHVSGGCANPGLLTANTNGGASPVKIPSQKGVAQGEDVFSAVVDAVGRLEGTGHLGPFACVLGEKMFLAANRPMPNSMVLPRDSILPFLDGPLLRSSAMPADKGVVVSLQGAPIEIVAPRDIAVKYLQTTLEAKHVFRVSERFVLRVKEPAATIALTL
jgi:uncharacterized linocin/CFP29 family protein